MRSRARLVKRALLAALAGLCALGACAPSKYVVDRKPADPFDAVIVPGCPSEEDGSPSWCQLGRAGHAALLWKGGWARNFIVSGAAVHTPYVEAEAIAQAMTALGVPPERIVLERDALHSDENVYYSMLIADRLELDRVAVATNEPIGSWMCALMEKWGHGCSAIDMDVGALERFMPPYEKALHALRAPRVRDWVTLDVREASHHRPPSFLYYPLYGWLGKKPVPPEHAPITWEDRLRELGRETR